MDPALKVYERILKDNDQPDRFRVAKDILDRNKLTGCGTAEDPQNLTYAPSSRSTFNVTAINFSELSDEGLDVVERLLQGLLAQQRASDGTST
jgi:hypothetical protein